jgi:hypothetical protein
MRNILPLYFISLLARGQAPQPSVSPEWDITQTITALAAQADRLKPILEQLTPQAWVKDGAPEAYVAQWQSARQELAYVAGAAKAMEREPERLTLTLDTYFRLQGLEAHLNSLVDGVRKYQNPAVGDLLVGVVSENSSNRDKLRQYITDLATQKEEEFAVVDKEAQRCRSTLSRPAAAPAKPAAPKPQGKQP